jgi:hypothetical protein
VDSYRIYTDSRWYRGEWDSETLPEYIEVPEVFISVDYDLTSDARAYIKKVTQEVLVYLPSYIDLSAFKATQGDRQYQVEERKGTLDSIADFGVTVFGSWCFYEVPSNLPSGGGQAIVSRIREETSLKVLGIQGDIKFRPLRIVSIPSRFERI